MTSRKSTELTQITKPCSTQGDAIEVSDKPYEAPTLICYGDVRDITLGPTFGAGESGCEGLFRAGPGGCPPP